MRCKLVSICSNDSMISCVQVDYCARQSGFDCVPLTACTIDLVYQEVLKLRRGCVPIPTAEAVADRHQLERSRRPTFPLKLAPEIIECQPDYIRLPCLLTLADAILYRLLFSALILHTRRVFETEGDAETEVYDLGEQQAWFKPEVQTDIASIRFVWPSVPFPPPCLPYQPWCHGLT